MTESFTDPKLQQLWIFFAVARNKARTDESTVSEMRADMEGLRQVAESTWDAAHRSPDGINPWRPAPASLEERIKKANEALNEALSELPGPQRGVSLLIDRNAGMLMSAEAYNIPVRPIPPHRQEKK